MPNHCVTSRVHNSLIGAIAALYATSCATPLATSYLQLAAALSLVMAPLPIVVAQPFVIERVMGSWEPVPGAEEFTWGGLAGAQIDDSGTVMFVGAWTLINGGVFAGTPGHVEPIIVTLTQAPGAPWPAPYNQFQYFPPSTPSLSESGFAAIRASIGNMPFSSSGGLYAGSLDNLDPVIFYGPANSQLPGQSAPGQPDYIVSGFTYPLTSSNGHVAYGGALYPRYNGPATTSVTAGTPGNLEVLGAPGLPVEPIPGATYVVAGSNALSMSDAGHVIFEAQIEGEVVAPGSSIGLFLHGPDGLQVAARQQSQVPNMPTGVVFNSFAPLASVSATGSVEFIASVEGPGVNSTNNWALWAGPPDDLHAAVREGDTTLGMPPGLEVDGVSRSTINDQDHILARGSLRGQGVDGSNDQAIWMGPLDAPAMIFREGNLAFGMPAGVVFAFTSSSDTTSLSAPGYVFNDSGDVLLHASVAGPGIGPANNVGLWFYEADTAAWSLVLREGDIVDNRAIKSINAFFNWESGYFHSFADDGSFALDLLFTDSERGVYRVTVPEPSAIVVLFMGLCALRRAPRAWKS